MKNSIVSGIVIGMIIPVLAYLLIRYTDFQANLFSDKPIALYVIAATINLIIFRFSYRAGKDLLAKGVLLITFVAMLLLIFGTKLSV